MASANEIGVIPSERCLTRSRYSSGEFDRMKGTRSPFIESVKVVSGFSAVAMQDGSIVPVKISPSKSDYEGDCSSVDRQIKSIERVNYIGHALLLPRGRVWCPRIRRRRDAERAFEIRADRRNGSRGYSIDLVRLSPPVRSRKVLGSPHSGYFRGHNKVPNQSALRAVFELTSVHSVGCLGVRSIAGLQASKSNLTDHGQDLPHPIAYKLLSAINSRLS